MIGFSENLQRRIEQAGVIAVVTVREEAGAVELAQVLSGAGIHAIELTLRTETALDCLRAVKKEVPQMLVGAGTVLSPGQVAAVREAGADFAVSPGCRPAVLAEAAEQHLAFAPGIATASDIENALAAGANLLKYFPAETSGGLAHLRTVAAPFRHLGLRFIPLGGIHEDTFCDYLREDLCLAIGGSWIARPEEIAARDWEAISAKARRAREKMETLSHA